MTNWRTTLTGAVGAVALALENSLSTGALPDRKTLVMSAVLALLGFLAKDFGISGETKA